MKNSPLACLISAIYLLTTVVWADVPTTKRTTLLANDQVNVWKTTIYPTKNQQLKPHRHEFNRVLIALNDGVLKVVNDQGKSHLLTLKKDQAYFLTKDIPSELHTDENLSGHVVSVIVVELKQD